MTVCDSSLRAAPALAVCVAALLVAGCGGGGKGGAKVLGGSNNTRQTAPACSSTNLPTWSPDGTQIAFVGRRLQHGMLPVRAICVANADGTQAMPLPHTVCTRRCRLDLIDSPSQLFWVSPNLLLYGDDYRIFTIPVGGEPELLGREPGSYYQFSVDSAGDRVAAGIDPSCGCAGPVTVLDVPSGKLAGRIGGKKLDNIEPSLSPDGKQVVFVRYHPGDSSFRPLGIWTASADGSQLQRLERTGGSPLWSPDGDKIAYLRGKAPNWPALLLVSPRGGKSTTLIPGAPCPIVGRCRSNGVMTLFGWSPDGSRIAFESSRQRLEIVDVATHKVRSLLKLNIGPSVAWSPDSQELLVRTQPLAQNRCASLRRVPADGGKPELLRNC